MKFNFQLSAVLGSVYKGGDVLFTADGRFLLSPVGNRLSVFDLLEHKVHTIDAATHRDIKTMALSPDGRLLLCIDEEGGGVFINMLRRVQLCQFHFKKAVTAVKFSPDSKLVAVGHGRLIQLWRCPALITQFRPLVLLRTLTGHYDEVTVLDWSHDGAYLLSGSEDMSVRVHRVATEGVLPEAEGESKVAMAGEGTKQEDGASSAAAAAAPAAAALPALPPIVLTGHRAAVVGAFFGQPSSHSSAAPLVYSVGKDGALFVWHWITEAEWAKDKAKWQKEEAAMKAEEMGEEEKGADDNKKQLVRAQETEGTHAAMPKRGNTSLFGGRGKFKLVKRHYFNQSHAKVLCCALHQAKQVDLLVVGFSSGVFGLYELSVAERVRCGSEQGGVLRCGAVSHRPFFDRFSVSSPDFNNIHTLSISQKRISSVSINSSGQWLAFGCAKLGQLLVWEWQSESYILKQQGHFYDINCLSFSPDGQVLATGGDDGKVKLWNTVTGFCFVTFTNHTAPITACHWSGVGNVLLTSSMDGTVRAFDLVRYRNFRTMTTPQPAQLVSLAVDPAGEVVCAGSVEPFEIYVWSLQTGKLLDVLTGHEGPLSGLSFASSQSLLASCS